MNPNSNNEYKYVSEDDDKTDLWFMTKAIEMHEMMEQEGGQSSRSRQAIYREYDDAEACLMRDYFGVVNNDITILNNSPLFDGLLDDIAPVAPFLLGATRWTRTGREKYIGEKGFGRMFLLTLRKTWEELFEDTMPSVQRMDENGSSDLVLFQNALAEFETGYKHPFTMEACWRILKNHEAWTEVEMPSYQQRNN
ncbi:hypothetical protein Tco_1017368 [Tanacetum coccineum]|uniref:Uncharacterized protein n=1 Tax=Tanacetum coccineum TaxID=301880 RepID=A0ABQ5FSP6_9ASTR